MLSSYYETLNMRGKELHKEKLRAVGLLINGDPYSPRHTEQFHYDISWWPKIEYGYIFAYIISRLP